MPQDLRDKTNIEEFKRFVQIIEKLREMLLGGGRDRLAEIEARLGKLEQAVAAGKVTPSREVQAVESGSFLGSLTSAVTQVQSSLLSQPGPVRFAMGPVKAQIKAHLESDDEGRVNLHLPRPGVELQELTLAQLDFSMVPLGSSEEDSEEVLVPSVVGQPLALARRQLEARQLTAGEIAYEEADGAAGRVLAQTPPAGATLLEGGTVAMVVSRSRYVEVPNVVGGLLAVAGKSLKATDLRYRATKRPASDAPPGTVLAQEPTAGEELERRSLVRLVVASAPRKPAPPAADKAPRRRAGKLRKTVRKVAKKRR